jgi:hypothetical protein
MINHIIAPEKLTAMEQEILFLYASIESIGSMVNYDLLDLSGGNVEAQAIFKTSIHQKIFNILLVDFLSKSSHEVTGKNVSLLEGLVQVCKTPLLENKALCGHLRMAVSAFKSWLDKDIKVPCYFPSIEHNGTLKLKRLEFIMICGDISKHSFARLSRRARDLKTIFGRNGKEICSEDALLLLDEFYDRFHRDIFSYHASHIAEKLNNIRWGIYEYLQPTIRRLQNDGDFPLPRHRFTYPINVTNEFVKHFYRELIGNVSSPPYFRRFKTHKALTLRF